MAEDKKLSREEIERIAVVKAFANERRMLERQLDMDGILESEYRYDITSQFTYEYYMSDIR